MISIILDGNEYSGWSEVSLSRKLLEISGTFTFKAVSETKLETLPIRRMAPVTVKINGVQALKGYIDKISIGYSAEEHSIEISGRDMTADLVDSKLSHEIEFKGQTTLEEVIRRVLSDIEATNIKVINKAGTIAPFSKKELVSGQIGSPAYELIDKYAQKREIIVSTDGTGALVLVRPNEGEAAYAIRHDYDGNTTIKAATYEADDSDRYNSYRMYSQGNPGKKKAGKSSAGNEEDRLLEDPDSDDEDGDEEGDEENLD